MTLKPLIVDGKEYVVVPVGDTAAHFDLTAHDAVLKLIEAGKSHSCNYRIGHPLAKEPCALCRALAPFSLPTSPAGEKEGDA